jgi:hypothetical protein
MKARFFASLLALLILASAARPETITRDLSFRSPRIVVSGGEAVLSIDGCRTIARAGAPMVPVYAAVFVLPPGEEIVSVTVTPLATEILPMPAPATPMPDQVSTGRAWSGVKGRDPSIYGVSAHWPPSPGELSTVQRKGGIALAYVNIYPLRPSGSGDTAIFTPQVSVTIETSRALSADKGSAERMAGRSATGLSALVENPAGLDAYGPDRDTVPGSYLSASPVPYVIITSTGLAGPFGQLASFRERHGLRVKIVTTEWIDSNYAGADLQERIRAFIRYAWQEWQTEYVLLGGDDSVIPHRGMYVKAGTEVETDIPSDLYYSCLDGNWNNDGDIYFGEPGEEDLFPEVSVGRLPVDSASQIDAFVGKLILYTETPPAGAGVTALMAGELLWSIDGVDTWGGDCKDEIVTGSDDFGFSTAGIQADFTVTTLYDRDLGSWGLSALVPLLNSGVNLVNHLGHANLHSVMRLPIYDLWRLDNVSAGRMPFVCYSQGCYPASFDNRDDAGAYYAEDCVGEQLVTAPEGAVAFVGNTRLGWSAPGSTCGVSQFFDRQFFDALFGEGITAIGRALDDSRVDNIPFLSYAAVRYVMYEMCLLGDPAMEVWTREPSALTVTCTDSLEAGEDYFEVNVSGADGPVKSARVSLMSGDPEIYYTELTGSDGSARLFVKTAGAAELELAVQASGYFTYNALLPVVEPAHPSLEIGWLAIDDSGAYGSGDGDGLIESGETVKIDLIISNNGNVTAENTFIRLDTGDDFLIPIVNIRSLGHMPPKTSMIMPAAFTVDVSESAPDGHLSSFDIEIESELGRRISRHTVALNAPGLVLDAFSLSDSPDGNGNGCLEAWEHLIVEAGWTNNGSVDIVSPVVTVSCPEDGWCRTVKARMTLDDIPIGASVVLPHALEIFVRESTPPFSPIEVMLTFRAVNIPSRTETLRVATCGYELSDPAEGLSACRHYSVTGYDGWTLTADDFVTPPGSWRCGGKNGDVYPNMTESCLVTPALCFGENTTLSFWHRMEAEASSAYPYWANDAAVVEISADGGATWQIITPLGNYPCRAASTNTIFLPAYARCYSGTIGWKQEIFDLSAFHGPALIRFHFASDEQYGFEGWLIDDISVTTDRVTGTDDPVPGVPAATGLLPAWPNPFNPATNIPFELSAGGHVGLAVYDVSGRMIRTLCDGIFEAGIHTVAWDGRDDSGRQVSSGVYFCRLRTGVYTASSRLVLLR